MTGPARVQHVLLVTGGRDVADLLCRLRPDLTITVLVSTALIGKVRRPDLCARVIAIAPSAVTAEWVALARHVHASDPVHAVAAFGEADQDRAGAMASALGLPFHTRDVLEAVYDKAVMRGRLVAAGVDPTGFAPVRSAADLADFAETHGFPLILKPATGTGSEGVLKLAGRPDLDSAMTRLAGGADGPLVVEPFLDGPELSVEAFSEGGRHRVVGVTAKSKDTNFVELGHSVRGATGADAYLADYVAQVLDTLGITYGPTHTELIRTEDGPRVVETHTRAGGDRIPQLLHAASGVDLLELAARQVLGERVLPLLDAQLAEPARPARYAVIRYLVPPAGGRLAAVHGVAAALAVPLVTGCQVLAHPGDPLIAPVRGSDDRVAYCTAVADEEKAAVAAAERAVSLLEVELDRAGAS